MRCPVCLLGSDSHEVPCAACGAERDGAKGRELTGVRYLLGQITVWESQGRVGATFAAALRKQYENRRDDLKTELCPRAVEPAPLPAPTPPPAPKLPPRPIPAPPPRPVVVAPPRPPFAWRDLCTEKNVRWILNLGILIFSVALAVFIHTQWKSMAPSLKVAILFGSSAAAMAAGHLLRRTILKATGTALIVLGAIAVPIDFMALLRFGLIDESRASQVGLFGSVASFGLYVVLVRFYREPLFEVLSTLAAAAAGAFALRTAGLEWPLVAPWIAPLAWMGTWAGRPAVRRTSAALLAGLVTATLGLLSTARLSVDAHAWPVELALAAGALASARARIRTGRAGWSWLTVAVLGVMFGVAAGASDWTWREARWPLALFGMVLGAGWLFRSAPFVLGSAAAWVLAVLASLPDAAALAGVLAVPGAFHLGLGLLRDDRGHVGVGGALLGASLVTALHGWGVPELRHPLCYAGAGVVFMLLSRVRAREAFHLLATVAAGSAMLFLAYRYSEYYLLKPAPAGQAVQLLGSTIAAVSAVAFGLLANRFKSRFVSDVTFGCIGLSYILLLRWAYVPGKWLGLSLAALGVAYVLFEKRISRWLQRPSLFTGIACTVAASTFAFLQWFVWREYFQSSLTFLLVGAFYLAVAHKTPYRWLSHVGMYVAAAGWLVGLRFLKVPPEMHAFLAFLPAGWTILVAARRVDLHLGLAALTVAVGALAFAYLDPTMYLTPNLPVTIAVSAAASGVAGMLAFRRPDLPGVDVRLASALMGAFAAAAYTFWMMYLSTGSPWGGLSLFVLCAVLGGAAEGLRRAGLGKQGWPLAAVGGLFSLFALFSAYMGGRAEGVHLWVHGLTLVLFTALGRTFRLPALSWGAAATGVLGLGAWLFHWPDAAWIGLWTLPLAALALQRREPALAALGWVAALVCPIHAAARLYEVPPAGLVFLGIAAAMAATRLRPVSYLAMVLAAVISWGHSSYGTLVLFGGFALYLGVSLATRKPLVIVVSLLLALAADFSLAEKFPAHSGLVAFPLAFVLLAMAWETTRRFGKEFGWPLLAASFAAAVLSSVLAAGHPSDRVWVFLADSLLFGAAAVLFRRPELMYLCSASVAALDLSLMSRFGLGSMQTAFQLLTLSLAQIIFVRVMGDRMRSYLQPVFVAALVAAGGVLVFGLSRPDRCLDRAGDINFAIWGLILLSLIAGAAGRIRKIPAFLYFAAAHLLGAYYLTLHKYRAETLELYTVPVGIGLVAWSALAGVEKRARTLGEVLAVGALFLPSAIPSFSAGQELHTLLALVLAVLLVLGGMAMRRRVLLLGGTGAFVAEVVGQGLRFLIEQQLSFAEWGMIVGALLMLVAAAFESRKTAFVKGRLEPLRAEAGKYLSTLE